MNDPTQHEFDDELLSAYLDDELSPDERALVEARLESDPVARQTLEHLRSVSQSVRDLPASGAGRGLHDAILRRIEESEVDRNAAQTAAIPTGRGNSSIESNKLRSQSPDNSPALPTVTIGRTTRGWIWACAAVAAALLIMFLQPDDDENAGLPNVAKNIETHSNESLDKELPQRQLKENRRDANDFARDDLSKMKPAPTELRVPATPTAPTASISGELSESITAPTAPPESALADNQAAASSYGYDSSRAGGQQMAELAESAPGASAEPHGVTTVPATSGRAGSTEPPAAQPIVVHVLANRYAIENNKFEDLLRSNGVVLEPGEPTDEAKQLASVNDGAEKRLARSERLSATAPADAPAETTDKLEAETEAVLVDAPAKTLVSCMSALNSDAESYPGIAVLEDQTLKDQPLKNQPESASETSDVAAGSREKEISAELSKFARGVVPPADVKFGADRYHFYAAPQAGQRGQNVAGRSDAVGGGAGGAFAGNKIESTITSGSTPADRGRARRIDPRSVERAPLVSRSFNFDTSAPSEPNANAQALGAPIAAAGDDRLQVLFIIHPSETTATATTPAPTLKAKLPAQQPQQ